MDSLKKEDIKLLWERFTNRIESEWPKKYTRYGSDINHVNAPTKFAHAVYADMENYFKATNRNVKVINPYTLHNYLQRGGFPTAVKAGTLDLFSMYLGYERFSDFRTKNTTRKVNHPKKHLPNIFTEIKRMLVPSLSVINTLLLLLVLWKVFFSNTNESDLKKVFYEKEIAELIHNAAQLEFNVRNPDTILINRLEDYYIADGPGIKNIKAGVEHIVRKNRRLHSNSHYEILSIKCNSVSDDEALVETEEKWRLIWYNTGTDKNEVAYDVQNKQTYYLKRINGQWKIYYNDYSGRLKHTASNLQKEQKKYHSI